MLYSGTHQQTKRMINDKSVFIKYYSIHSFSFYEKISRGGNIIPSMHNVPH